MASSFTENDIALLVAVFKHVNISSEHNREIAEEMGITTSLLSSRMGRFRTKLGLYSAGSKKDGAKTTGAAAPKKKAGGGTKRKGKKETVMNAKEGECDDDDEDLAGDGMDWGFSITDKRGGGSGGRYERGSSDLRGVKVEDQGHFSAQGLEYGIANVAYSLNEGRKRAASSDMGGTAKRMASSDHRVKEENVFQDDSAGLYYDDATDEEV